eukprot:g70673.t1
MAEKLVGPHPKRRLLGCLIDNYKNLSETSSKPPPHSVTEKEVLEERIRLSQMVVQALDKNNNELLVECPVLTWERIQQEIIKAPSFLLVSTDRDELLHNYRTDVIKHNLQRFGALRTRKAAIHSTTLLLKEKQIFCKQNQTNLQSSLIPMARYSTQS